MTTSALHPGYAGPTGPGLNIKPINSTEDFIAEWADEGRTLIPDDVPDFTNFKEVLGSVMSLEFLGRRPAKSRKIAVLAHVSQSLHDPADPCVKSGRVRAVRLGRAIDNGLTNICSRCGDHIEIRMSGSNQRVLQREVERVQNRGPSPYLLPLVGVGIHAIANRQMYGNPLSSNMIMAQALKPLNVIEDLKESHNYGAALSVILSDSTIQSAYSLWQNTEERRWDVFDDECWCW